MTKPRDHDVHAYISDHIGSRGYAPIYVLDDEDPSGCFAYTVGMTGYKLPELLICGPYSPDDAYGIITAIAERLIEHPDLAGPGTVSDILSYPVRFVAVNDPRRFFEKTRYALEWIEERSLTALPPLQIQLSDTASRFPGDPGFDYFSPTLL